MSLTDRDDVEIVEQEECLLPLAAEDVGRIGVMEGTNPSCSSEGAIGRRRR